MGPILLADSRNPELRAALQALRPDLELLEESAGAEVLRRCAIWLGEPDQAERVPGSLCGRRVLIVGAGEIGREVARLLAPFGVRLTGVAHRPRPLEHFEQVVGLDSLHEAAGAADYIVNILPDTAGTDGIYDDAFFAALDPAALFLNIGRGNAVVDDALIRALCEGRLAGAVLDVFREEPLPAAHPFWDAPNLAVTGHIAGPLVPAAVARLFVANLARFQAGEALLGEVEFASAY